MLMAGREVTVTKENKNNHFIGLLLSWSGVLLEEFSQHIVTAAVGADPCSLILVGVMLLVVLSVAEAMENKSNPFFGFASGRFILAVTHGAGAVSGSCFNPAVVIGLEVASIHLDLG